ncbi:MAG: ADP-ribosyltransferase [Coriobacteriia bacterium]|nr:ADP-ribosyltransferase [Coriobacteriia bacterium]
MTKSDLVRVFSDAYNGVEIPSAGFMSTSFQRNRYGVSRPIEMILEAPKGSNGVFIESLSGSEVEREILFARGTSIRIIGVSVDDRVVANEYGIRVILHGRLVTDEG